MRQQNVTPRGLLGVLHLNNAYSLLGSDQTIVSELVQHAIWWK